MKKYEMGIILMVVFNLVACGRSKNPDYYILNPIPLSKTSTNIYHNLRIGIDKISVPAYIEKPQLIINYTPHRMQLEEDEQWIEGLDKNIARVIVTNLSTLLPGAIVNTSPWEIIFKPNYHLEINISQFTIDVSGNSVLRADYTIYQDEHLIGKHNFYTVQKIPVVNTENLVISMNSNLNHLTQDIARYFKHNHKNA
ncbi:PqiC family protein [Legionella fallonii]|uniref:ABC-type transport auxiliary lipoprotein component domain-containing protein n=1 Tax=Legionella fallonii LLAP-10 TaxID=1212491 RepID=A0A098G2R4_9GAMM|nr:PqiC family protein [Legionella fallonii]CEG56276.1 conserved protein of unknown function [Legionella fallonii LLAP-10]